LEKALKDKKVKYVEEKLAIYDSGERAKLNYEKSGMQKLVDEYYQEHGGSHMTSFFSYSVKVERGSDIAPSKKLSDEAAKQCATRIRKITGWEVPVASTTITDFKNSDEYFFCVEDKRKHDNDQQSPVQKILKLDETFKHRQEEVKKESHEKKTGGKIKSQIDEEVDLKDILMNKLLSVNVALTLREVLSLAKKEFHELIINLIRRKRQVPVHVNEADLMKDDMTVGEKIVLSELKFIFEDDPERKEKEEKTGFYNQPCWARATTETKIQIGD
jgi:hypothetical protein